MKSDTQVDGLLTQLNALEHNIREKEEKEERKRQDREKKIEKNKKLQEEKFKIVAEKARNMLSGVASAIEEAYERNPTIQRALSAYFTSFDSGEHGSLSLFKEKDGTKHNKRGGSCGAGNNPGTSYTYSVDNEFEIILWPLTERLNGQHVRNWIATSRMPCDSQHVPYGECFRTYRTYFGLGSKELFAVSFAVCKVPHCLFKFPWSWGNWNTFKKTRKFLKTLSDYEVVTKCIVDNKNLINPWMRGEYNTDYMLDIISDNLKFPKTTSFSI